MAFNLVNSFQVATTAPKRSRSRKRRTHYRLEMIQILRYKWLNRAAVVVHPDGHPTLDVGSNTEVANRFIEIDKRLPKAA
jgi:hypothetical protein